MTFIHLALTIFLIGIHLAAVTVVTSRWLPPQLAKVTGVLIVTLVLFAIEHVVGLGSLNGLWPITTVGSLIFLWQTRVYWWHKDFGSAEAVFWSLFAFALIWRLFIPDIKPSTELLANLYFISNYSSGERLPPPDLWLTGKFKFDFYYGFQHYAAALMARLFDLTPGLAMNLAQPLLIAFIGSLGAFAISQFVKSWLPQLALVAALVAGGNGLTPLLQFMLNEPAQTAEQQVDKATTQIWAATRFSGVYDARINTREGIYFFEGASWNDRSLEKLDLPYETISFYSFVGDYHPPLGGFALLALALALIGWLHTGVRGATHPRAREVASGVLAATPVLCLVINAWSFPLQSLVVAAYVGFAWWERRSKRSAPLSFTGFVVGGVAALTLVLPFLIHFVGQTSALAFERVPDAATTRSSVWWGLHWPAVCLATMAVLVGRRERWLWWVVGVLIIVLLVSEYGFVNEGSAGPYLRFNTTIKWWSWTLPFVLIGLAAPLFAAGGRAVRVSVITISVLLLLNVINGARYLWNVEPPTFGRVAGDGWLRSDPVHSEMLTYLRNAPRGVVLEGMNGAAYNNTGAFSLFAEKSMVLGWPGHEALWRRNQPAIWALHDEIQLFFAGHLTDPLRFLAQHDVTYVLWTRWDEVRNPGGAKRISAALIPQYRFKTFESLGDVQIGMWVRQGAVARIQSPTGFPSTLPSSRQP